MSVQEIERIAIANARYEYAVLFVRVLVFDEYAIECPRISYVETVRLSPSSLKVS